MAVLSDAKEFGKRVASARGYALMKRPAFGKLFGVSEHTVKRWETAEDINQDLQTEEGRARLAEKIVEKTNCPRYFFELDEAPTSVNERLEALDNQVAALRQVVLRGSKADDARGVLETADAAFRQIQQNGGQAASPASDTESGEAGG